MPNATAPPAVLHAEIGRQARIGVTVEVGRLVTLTTPTGRNIGRPYLLMTWRVWRKAWALLYPMQACGWSFTRRSSRQAYVLAFSVRSASRWVRQCLTGYFTQ
jgi:hypothetical protein